MLRLLITVMILLLIPGISFSATKRQASNSSSIKLHKLASLIMDYNGLCQVDPKNSDKNNCNKIWAQIMDQVFKDFPSFNE